jgi:hypothetical protein
VAANAEAQSAVIPVVNVDPGRRRILVKTYDANGALVDPLYVDVIGSCATSATGAAGKVAWVGRVVSPAACAP